MAMGFLLGSHRRSYTQYAAPRWRSRSAAGRHGTGSGPSRRQRRRLLVPQTGSWPPAAASADAAADGARRREHAPPGTITSPPIPACSARERWTLTQNKPVGLIDRWTVNPTRPEHLAGWLSIDLTGGTNGSGSVANEWAEYCPGAPASTAPDRMPFSRVNVPAAAATGPSLAGGDQALQAAVDVESPTRWRRPRSTRRREPGPGG
jgi:hypothetical protein